MKTLRLKILVAALVLVLVCQAATVTAVLLQAHADAEVRAIQSLLVTSGVLRSYLSSRHRQLANTVDILASDFAFRQAVATQDISTVRSALRNHASRVGANYAVIYEPSGAVLAATSDSAPVLSRMGAMVQGNNDDERVVVADSGDVYQSVLVPLRAPLQIGTASMGFIIDDALAMQLKSLTGDDVSFAVVRNGATTVAASTLDPLHREQLTTDLAGGIASAAAMPEYFIRSELLSSGSPTNASATDAPVYAVLLRSRHDAMGVFDALARSMLLLAALSAAIAMATAALLAGSLTRPLVALVTAARRIRDGDYSTRIGVGGSDEIGDLARTVDSMQTEIAQREHEVRYQATHDVLTGLPNRIAATQELDRRIAAEEPFWILAIGFLGIHEVNSTLGLEVGDAIVVAIARRLREHAGEEHFVARLSDTRFAVVRRATDALPPTQTAIALRAAFESKPLLDDAQVSVRASIGIAGYPVHARDAEGIVRRAWIASMDAAAAPEGAATYDAQRDADHARRLQLIEDLRRAIGTDQLSLVYQPQYNIRSGRIEAAEALVRWRHPTLGNVSPAEFIPLAEQSNTIKLLTRWVFTQACAQAVEWRRQNLGITISVNISANDLEDISFPAFVLKTLDRLGVPPSALELEVTETALAENLDRMIESLRILRGLEFKLAIDDFGTGFSSLAQLKRLPISVLKIDRSFVSELEKSADDSLIVRSTIELAHGMGLTIVAEGVETLGAAQLLAQWGAETLQGYLLSPPLPAAALENWMRETDFAMLRSATQHAPRKLELAR
jgi:diguanylate cyclase (GGDEF)-like protein